MEQDNTIQQNRSKRFLKAIGLYAIGNLGSKLITFLMVPLYTYFVNPADYGFYDICLTLVLLAIPFMTLQLRDGAFRFLVDNENEKIREAVITFAYKMMIRTAIAAVALAVVIGWLYTVKYLWLAVMLLITMSFYEVVIQITRGLGNTVSFVSAGIISALGIGIFSVVFVVCFDLGIVGIFWANILARFVALIYVEYKDRIIRRYLVKSPDYVNIRKEIMKYSLPLIPGVVLWWIVGSSDRFFIQHYLGLSANGIYAVVFRFTSVLQVLSTIFYQAWQETALRQYNSDDRDMFFSKMFNSYLYVLSCVLIVFVFALKLNYSWLVSDEFAESVEYLYPMAVSVLLFALAAFMDMGYQCSKDTKRTLPAIIFAAIVNLVSNYFLVELMGLWGVVITSIITYIVLLVYRIHDMKRYFKLQFHKRSVLPLCMLILGLILYYFMKDILYELLFLLFVIVIYAVFSPDWLRTFVQSKWRKDVSHN